VADNAIPQEVLDLLYRHALSMDHVEVLLHLHGQPEVPLRSTDLARSLPITERTIAECLTDLARSELVVHDPALDTYLYDAAMIRESSGVDALRRMYDERPVSLVRCMTGR
jgi:DNA-binding IclR family transcriptional regulator